MKSVFCISGAVAAMLLCTPALAYDDPAVAACEYSRFYGTPPSAQGYSRTKAEVDGTSVRLEYERSVLNTAPKLTALTCAFKKTDNGNFVFKRSSDVDPNDPKVQQCRSTVAEGQKKLEQGNLDISDTALIRTNIALCDRTLGVDPDADAELDQIEIDLKSFGIYPIAADNTSLK